MKKVVIGMLMLLPLIIVAAVLFAIDIISVEAYIGVQRVEIGYTLNNTRVQGENIAMEFDLSQGEFRLEAIIFPTGARNQNVQWEIIDEFCAVNSGAPFAEINFPYALNSRIVDISVFGYGVFTIEVRTLDGDKRATCVVHVKGDEILDINLSFDPLNEVTAKTLKQGEAAKIYAVFRPYDAIIGGKDINFISSCNGNTVRIDQNGIITAVAITEQDNPVTITAVVLEGENQREVTSRNQLALTIEAAASPFGDSVYWYGDSYNGEGSPHVTKVNDKNEIIIEHSQHLNQASGFELRIGGLPLVLNAIFKAHNMRTVCGTFNGELNPPSVEWGSDSDIATINSHGVVTPHASGTVTFYAVHTHGGINYTASITVVVVRPISFLRLEMTNAGLARGIAQETRFGNRELNAHGNLVEARITFNILIPTAVSFDDLVFEIDGGNGQAKFYDNVLVLYGDYSLHHHHALKVTISAKHRPFPSVEVLRFVDLQIYNGINVYSYDHLIAATATKEVVFLQRSLYRRDGAQCVGVRLYNDLHGNGFTLSGVDAHTLLTNRPTTVDAAESFVMLHIVASDVRVSNINVINDVDRITIPNGMAGIAILVGVRDRREYITNVTIEFSVIEYALSLVRTLNADLLIEGCILRNASNFGIDIPSHQERRTIGDTSGTVLSQWTSNVTLKNLVMSNIVAPAVGISASGSGAGEPTIESSLHIKGFLDIYNWQDLTSAEMINRGFIPGNPALNSMLTVIIRDLLETEFAKSDYAHVRYSITDENGTVNFMHLGICAAGGIAPFNGEITFCSEGEASKVYHFFDLKILHSGDITALNALGLEPVIFYLYLSDNPPIRPRVEPVETRELREQLKSGR
jgi:uncharacterized protein YjdB